ncbi:MAG: flagellar basal body rod protein FlgF [Pseudomonadota bacterium]
MDKMLYVAMTGASQTLLGQAANSNNLANVSTTGFRADLAQARAMPVLGEGVASRVYSMQERPGFDLSPGVLQTTGRPLDVAIDGAGWFVVQSSNGTPGLTRAGDFRVSSETGLLENGAGHIVLGDEGPIVLPPHESVQVSADGAVSFQPQGALNNQLVSIGRLQLVNPNPDALVKGNDGLVRLRDGTLPASEASVRVISGTLEGSNVNMVDGLVEMISLSRQFELQVRMMSMADDLATRSARIMELS